MTTEQNTPETTQGAPAEDQFLTANDRFKQSFGSWFWGSILAATALHFVVLAFWPQMSVDDYAFVTEDVEVIELPPEIELPPPPEQIQRPAQPVITDAQIDEDITIAPTTFDENLPEDLPPPPAEGEGNLADQPAFTPYTVEPEIQNRAEIGRLLEREYPSILRDAGIGGQVLMYFFITEDGVVENFEIAESSGHRGLDEAALRLAPQFQFSPAYNRDERVPVWIQIPITFQTN